MDKLLLDVICPATSRHYDFWVSKKLHIGTAKERIISEIKEYEDLPPSIWEGRDLFLYWYRHGKRLDEKSTFEHAGVKSGDRIMLI